MSNTGELEKRLCERFGCNAEQVKATTFNWSEVLAAARIAAEIERQACAELLSDNATSWGPPEKEFWLLWAADAIRARGKR